MTLHLTAEQEQRIQAVIRAGAYESVEEVPEAAIAAAERRALPGFAPPDFEGSEAELEALLLEGLNSPEMGEDAFWTSVDQATDGLLTRHKA